MMRADRRARRRGHRSWRSSGSSPSEIVTGFARIEGRAVGIVANQPKYKGGVLFVDSADKAARFIWLCDAFNVPLLFLADVPGFMIGTKVERAGHHPRRRQDDQRRQRGDRAEALGRGAQGLRRRPLRDGGPAFEPRRCIALPTASIAVMGPQAAVNAVYFNKIQAIAERPSAAACVAAAARRVRGGHRHREAGERAGRRRRGAGRGARGTSWRAACATTRSVTSRRRPANAPCSRCRGRKGTMDFQLDDAHRRDPADGARLLRGGGEAERPPLGRDRASSRCQTVRKLGELGLLGITVPEEFGGSGLDMLSVAVVVEEVARYDGSLALTVASHNGLGSSQIRFFASDAQKRRWLVPAARARSSRPGGSPSREAARMRPGLQDHRRSARRRLGPERVEDVHHPGHRRRRLRRARPDLAREGAEGDHRLRAREGDAGVQPAAHSRASSGCAAPTPAELVTRGRGGPRRPPHRRGRSRVPRHPRHPRSRPDHHRRPGRGARAAARWRRRAPTPRSARPSGKPIAEFQAIAFALADMATEIDAARLLVWRAAALGRRREALHAARPRWASSSRARRPCGRRPRPSRSTADTATPAISRWSATSATRKLCEIGEGTSEVQRMVIARSILRQP